MPHTAPVALRPALHSEHHAPRPGDRFATRGSERDAASESARARPAGGLLSLQQSVGNQAVGRLLGGAAGGGLSRGPQAMSSTVVQHHTPPAVQHHTKRSSAGGDAFEAEAESVADRVMASPGGGGAGSPSGAPSGLPSGSPSGSRSRSGGAGSAGRDPGAAFKARLGDLGPGQPLGGGARGFLEPRFGADLGHVRLHDGPDAHALAKDVGAKALTHREHVVLGARAPRSHGPERMHLLAHEITHTFQQGARVRSLAGDGALGGVHQTAPTVQRIEDQESATGYFLDWKKARIRARNVLDDLQHKRIAAALARYREDDIAYHKAVFLGGASWVKWFRGVSGDFDRARVAAKALYEKPAKEKAKKEHAAAIAKVAAAGHAAAGVEHVFGTNHEHSAAMAQKIAWYLINALPDAAVQDAIAESTLGRVSGGHEHPVAMLMMGGSGSGKSRVRALGTLNSGEMVVADADAVKELLPAYRKSVQEGDESAARTHHETSQSVTAGIVRQAIADRRHLLYDATGANQGTYLGGSLGIFGREGLFKMLKDEGYAIRLVMTYVPEEIGLERTEHRARETGRHVPSSIVRSTHADARRNFVQFAQDPRVDDALLYENMGQEPMLVWQKGKGKIDNKEITKIKLHLGELDEQEYKAKLGYSSDLKYISNKGVGSTVEKWLTGNDETSRLAQSNRLTVGELAAIRLYTKSDYHYINPALANDMTWMSSQFSMAKGPEQQQVAREEGWQHARFAIKGLKKLPAVVATTYRGAGFTAAEIAEKYPLGETITMPSFTSTSVSRARAAGFAQQRTGGDKLGVLFETEVKTGRDVAPFSEMAHEEEVLLLPYTRFRVTRIGREGRAPRVITVIRLVEV